jgi:hypothetical protein
VPDPHQTAAWPRARLQHHAVAATPGTRLDLGRLAASEPTEPISPILPTSVPPVRPIPERTRREAPRSARLPEPSDTPRTGDPITPELVGKILDQQHELNLGMAARIRRIGPGGIFGWRPLGGPTLAEVAAARQKIAEREAARRTRHARHMDTLDTVKAYLVVLALTLLVLLVGSMAYVSFGIMIGWYEWAPTRT